MTETNPVLNLEPVIQTKVENIQEPNVAPVVLPSQAGNTTEDLIKFLSTSDAKDLVKYEPIQRLLENARQQEKDKLYSTITSKEDTIKQLNDTVVDLQNKAKSKEDEYMGVEKELLEKINSLVDNHEKLVKDMETEKENTRMAKLEAHKTAKINEANGEIIASLVKGSTEEEIDASVEIAKQEYINITAPLKQQLEESAKPNKANAPKPSNPATPPSLEFTAEDIRRMSPEEYKKHRPAILGMTKN